MAACCTVLPQPCPKFLSLLSVDMGTFAFSLPVSLGLFPSNIQHVCMSVSISTVYWAIYLLGRLPLLASQPGLFATPGVHDPHSDASAIRSA